MNMYLTPLATGRVEAAESEVGHGGVDEHGEVRGVRMALVRQRTLSQQDFVLVN